ncbi:hypothetical protein BKA93DRAFT_802813 [Sparassis latifolia]
MFWKAGGVIGSRRCNRMATCMQRAQSTTSRIVFCSKTYLFTFDNDSLRCSVSHILVTYEPTSNRSTRSSKAVAMLRATRKYRWRLTGTPVTNTLADIYGLIRFGRFRL